MASDEIELELWQPTEVYDLHVKGRALLFFDSNIWIDLAEAKTDIAKDCLALCERVVVSGVALVPLSYHVISELLEQPLPERVAEHEVVVAKQAAIMDKLSLGVCFRSPIEIRELEAWGACPIFEGIEPDSPPVREIFTYVGGHVGRPLLCGTAAYLKDPAFLKLLQAEFLPKLRSVAYLTQLPNLRERIRADHPEMRAGYAGEMNSVRDKLMSELAAKGRKPAFKEVLQLERQTMLKGKTGKALSAAWLRRFAAKGKSRFSTYEGKARTKPVFDDLEKLFSAMPSQDLLAQVCTARELNRSERTTSNDFHDNGIASMAPAYVGTVVTRDRNLADLIGRRLPMVKQGQCKVVNTLGGLKDCLQALVS